MPDPPPVVAMHLPLVVVSVLLAALAVSSVAAQTCGAGERLLKNDILPDNPSGSSPIGIVSGLCDNEAAMSLFDAGGPVKVTSVAIGYGHRFGTNGVQAVVDVEIYDGATLDAAGRWTLGPLLFRLSNGSSNAQIQSTGINVLQLPLPVRVPSGKPVIGFRMLLNTAGGSCAFGYDANFFCDADNRCRPGINILDAIGHGPVDPVTGVLSLTYIAPNKAGMNYLALGGGSIVGGGFQSPFGRVPLDLDPLFMCFLTDCRSLLIGGAGVIDPNGRAFGGMLIPNLASLRNSGLTIYLAFVLYGQTFQFTDASSPSRPIVIN